MFFHRLISSCEGCWCLQSTRQPPACFLSAPLLNLLLVSSNHYGLSYRLCTPIYAYNVNGNTYVCSVKIFQKLSCIKQISLSKQSLHSPLNGYVVALMKHGRTLLTGCPASHRLPFPWANRFASLVSQSSNGSTRSLSSYIIYSRSRDQSSVSFLPPWSPLSFHFTL